MESTELLIDYTTTPTPSHPETFNANHTSLETARIIVDGYFLIFVGILGIIGNSLSIWVFSQKHMRRSSINILLIGLQVSDLFAVVGLMLHDGLPLVLRHLQISYDGTSTQHYIARIFYPVHFSAEVASHFFTCLVTLERYVAVCHPLKVPIWCSRTRAKIWTFITFLFSTLMVVPISIDFQLTEQFDRSSGDTSFTEIIAGLELWHVIGVYLSIILMFVVPVFVLIGFNIAIYKEFRKTSKQRKRLSATIKPIKSSSERSLSLLLFAIVITFIFCNSFQIICDVQGVAFPGPDFWWLRMLTFPCMKFFLTFNSSVNFIFYCWFGKKFREELYKLMKCQEIMRFLMADVVPFLCCFGESSKMDIEEESARKIKTRIKLSQYN